MSAETMANTFTQIHIHTVFAVQNRVSLIQEHWREELYRYITGIVQNKGHKLLALGGTADHIHMFFGLKPAEPLSDLMKTIKSESSKWINDKGFVCGKFSWQEGYAAFSYSKSQIDSVIHYIRNQEQHHHKTTFIEEYVEFLRKFEIDFDERYIFTPITE